MALISNSSAPRANIDFFMVLGILGAFIFFMGFALLMPAGIDLIYGQDTWHSFLVSAGIAFSLGGLLWYFFKPQQELRIREGFLIVSLTWLSLSLVGALPFVISGVLPSFTDAVFETMSGLTTTGSTILGGATSDGFQNPQIEDIPKSFLFWRSLAHWLGGMGIIVLSLAILPLLGIGGMQLFQAEAPGPTADKLTPRIQETAKLLWIVYVVFTSALFVLLWIHPKMDWFEAINHAFATLATGGFSTKNANVEFFDSLYIDFIITIFMFFAGMNFALHFKLFRGEPLALFKDREIRFYAIFCGLVVAAATIGLRFGSQYNWIEAFQYGSFQVMSITTATGFGTNDYELWGNFAFFILFICFFTGGCTGSTCGGIKMVRWYVLLKNTIREFKMTLHPKAILPIRMGDKVVSPNIIRNVVSFFLAYLLCFIFGGFVLALCGFDLISALGASIACLGNIGPGLGEFGPTDNFAAIPYLGKWVLIMLMMVGRLEIFTVLIIFSPAFWKQ